MEMCIPFFLRQLLGLEVFACLAVEVAPVLFTGMSETQVIITTVDLAVRVMLTEEPILSGVHLTSPPGFICFFNVFLIAC
jgi:hypothetical protein